jgi:hypothetical protein
MRYDSIYIDTGVNFMSDKEYDAGYYKGLAEGHYQADSIMKTITREQNKGNDTGAAKCSYPSKMKAAHSAGKAYGGRAGLKK